MKNVQVSLRWLLKASKDDVLSKLKINALKPSIDNLSEV